jgi:hypothetical protein
MNLSRATQLTMLEALADVYPRLTEHIGVDFTDDDNLANLWYLKEQGLVEGKIEMAMDQTFVFQGVRITAKGMDFLADDGGVSAILGTVTVRVHPDSIKDLLLAKVEASSAPAEKKTWLKKQLETATNESIKKILNALLDEGIKHAPDLLRLIEQAAKSVA